MLTYRTAPASSTSTHPPAHPADGARAGVLPAAEQVTYHTAYQQRRALSTMAEVARAEVTRMLARHRAQLDNQVALRILSLGCGDGTLDLPVLAHLGAHGPVDYLGVDTNEVSLQAFATELTAHHDPGAEQIRAELHCVSAEDFLAQPGSFHPGSFHPGSFHVVLISHLLYYLPDPSGLVAACVSRLLTGAGQVIVVHSAQRGIPEVLDQLDGCTAFITAETIAEQCRGAGLGVEIDLHPCTFDLTDLLATDLTTDLTTDTAARALLGFVLEVDLDAHSRELAEAGQAALAAHCHTVDDRQILTEDLGIIRIGRPPMSPTPRVDPLEDYYRLADALDWERLLAQVPRGADGVARVLDLGCGTGRWLQVLASTSPRLASGAAAALHYSVLDPTAEALAAIAPLVTELFTPDEMFPTTAETADLAPGRYGMIWSMHSLYGVRDSALRVVLSAVHRALHPEGTAYLVLADARSFYVRAAAEVLGTQVFRSADEICATLDALGLHHEVSEVAYSERFAVSDDLAVRHYLWMESIGNTFLPAGAAHDALPALPDTAWWHSHRHGDEWVFPQYVQIITLRGGQMPMP